MCANTTSADYWLLEWITKRRRRIWKLSATQWTRRGMSISPRSRALAIVSFGITSRKTVSHKAADERSGQDETESLVGSDAPSRTIGAVASPRRRYQGHAGNTAGCRG